jgi:hypothetical protein
VCSGGSRIGILWLRGAGRRGGGGGICLAVKRVSGESLEIGCHEGG